MWSYQGIESTQETLSSESAESNELDVSNSSESGYIDSMPSEDENSASLGEEIENDIKSEVDDIDNE